MTTPTLTTDAERRAQLDDAVQSSARALAATRPAATPPPGTRTPYVKVDQTAVAFAVFSRLLATDGVRAALYSLLRRTDYRFIAIFRFKDGQATSAVYVDRENLNDLQAAEVPDTATYCCYVRDGGGAFVTADALMDSRTAGHAARDVVRAYCGIPVMDPEGTLIGTLCHYDLLPRDPEQLDLELLLQVASALSRPGVVPPYPTLG